MDLARGGQAAHRFPHPRARGDGGEEDLDLLAGGGVHRLQVHGDQQRKSGDLGGGAAGLERPAVTHALHLPARRLAGFPQDRGNAQGLPQLAQGAQHRGFGKLAAQRLPRLVSGHGARLLQNLPQLQHQGRDFVPGGFLRSMLPVRIAAQGENEGQRFAVGEKIRLLPHRAQQVERHHAAGGDQPRQQLLRLPDGGRTRRGLPASQASFHERGGRRRQLRLPGQIKT